MRIGRVINPANQQTVFLANAYPNIVNAALNSAIVIKDDSEGFKSIIWRGGIGIVYEINSCG